VQESKTGYAPPREKIGRQIVLPLSKAFEIAWKGIRIRLWRSLITMSGIVLAIAFLTSVWVSNGFTNALRAVGPQNPLYAMVQSVLEAQAMSGGGGGLRCVVVQEQGEPQMGRITASASIYDMLQSMKIFRAELLPPDVEALKALLLAEKGARPDAVVMIGLPEALAEGEAPGVLRTYVGDGGLLLIYGVAGLDSSSGSGVEGTALEEILPAQLGEQTFTVDAGEVSESSHVGARWYSQPRTDIVQASARPGAQALANAGPNGVIWRKPVGKGAVLWYPVAQESATDADQLCWFLHARPMAEAGSGEERSSLLVRLIAVGLKEQFTGGEGNMRGLWLVGLSLLVGVVGITNAMLMSVTERFREIGTMKCLGALDKFIVKLFLIESSLQGIAGSIAGALLGFGVAFLRALFAFHVKDPETGQSYWLAAHFFPMSDILTWIGIALITGVALTIVAAIYPAIRAARMQPVQAMRAEA